MMNWNAARTCIDKEGASPPKEDKMEEYIIFSFEALENLSYYKVKEEDFGPLFLKK